MAIRGSFRILHGPCQGLSLARAVLPGRAVMRSGTTAQYRRARRQLDRRIAKAIDEAITSAYLETLKMSMDCFRSCGWTRSTDFFWIALTAIWRSAEPLRSDGQREGDRDPEVDPTVRFAECECAATAVARIHERVRGSRESSSGA